MKRLAFLLAFALAACSGDTTVEPETPDQELPGDETPASTPTVTTTSPADNARGIEEDATITFQFSVPMDQDSVEENLDTSELGAVSFEWNAAGDTLNIIPEQPLEYAEGVGLDPSVVDANEYSVQLYTGARDLEGNLLDDPFAIRFTTLKRMSGTLEHVNELTAAGTPEGVTTDEDDFLYIGDDDMGGLAKGYRAYISMDLAEVPADAEIESAKLSSIQFVVQGNPYEDLGNQGMLVEHTLFELGTEAAENAAFNASALSMVGTLAVSDDLQVSIDVTEQVADDILNRAERNDLSQYRLRFSDLTNLDDTADYSLISRNDLELSVVFLAE